MSIKSITFLAGLCVMLSVQSSAVRADYVDAEDDFEITMATIDMRPLLEDHENSPITLEKEAPSSVISMMEMPKEVEKFFKDQDIMKDFLDDFMAPASTKDIVEEYETLMFAQKIGFLWDGIKEAREKRRMLEEQSRFEQMENVLRYMMTY